MTDADLTARLDRIDGHLERIDSRLNGVDGRLEALEGRFVHMVDVLEKQSKLLLALEARMESGFAALNGRVTRLSEMMTRGFICLTECLQLHFFVDVRDAAAPRPSCV